MAPASDSAATSVSGPAPADTCAPVTAVWCGISTLFHNKENRAALKLDKQTGQPSNRWAFGFSFYPSQLTPDDLIAHILKGGAWTPNRFSENRRIKSAFVSGQILALDFDNAEEIPVLDAAGQPVRQDNGKPLMQEIKRSIGYASYEAICQDPFVQAYALLVYASPSSTTDWHKTRVVFLLDSTADHAGQWETLQRGLMRHFAAWYPDAACKDTARLYYGSTNQTAAPRINPDAVLPLALAGQLTADEALEDFLAWLTPPMARVVVTGAKGERMAQRVYESLLTNIAGASANRHATIMKNVRAMAGYAAAGTLGFDYAGIERDAIAACGSNGYQSKVGLNEVTRIVRDAIKQGSANPLTLTLPDKPKRQKSKDRKRAEAGAGESAEAETANPLAWTPTVHHPLNNAHLVNVPFLTADHLQTDKSTIVIKSDMGTNKTGAVVDMVRAADSALIVSPLVRLTESAARRFGTEVYNDGTSTNARWTGTELLKMSKLSITPHSLFKLMVLGMPLPRVDYLAIDEFMPTIAALFSPLIPDYRRLTIYKVLKQLISQAKVVIVMDAHLTDEALEFIRVLRGADTVYTLENTYQRDRGAAHVYEHKSRLIKDAEALINEGSGRAVVIATNSKKQAKALEKYLAGKYGAESGICVHSENAEHPRQSDFIRHMADRINGYRWVIYTPTIGSGIDVSRDSAGRVVQVRAIVGLFMAGDGRRGTTATEMHQQLNRCRFADELLIYVQRRFNQLDTDVNTLTERGIKNAEENGRLLTADFDENGIPVLSPEKRKIHRLEAIMQAQRNRSMTNVYADFMTLLTGCKALDYVYGKDAPTDETMKAVAAEQAQLEKELTLIAPALSPEEFEAIPAADRNPEHSAGVVRYQIEKISGITPITPDLYDLLHAPDDRRRLERLRDLTQGTYREALERDGHDRGDTGKTLLRAGNNAQLFNLYCELFDALGLEDGLTPAAGCTWTADNLTIALDKVLPDTESETRRARLKRLFERRDDYSDNPFKVIQHLFAHIGLKFYSDRKGRGEQRQMVYRLDSDRLTQMLALAETSRARWEADHTADNTAECTTNQCVDNILKHGNMVQPRADTHSANVATVPTMPATPAPQTASHKLDMKPVQLPALHPVAVALNIPGSSKGSVLNPFSEGYRAEVLNTVIETVRAARVAQHEPDESDGYTDCADHVETATDVTAGHWIPVAINPAIGISGAV